MPRNNQQKTSMATYLFIALKIDVIRKAFAFIDII